MADAHVALPGGHTLEIDYSRISGMEHLLYDDQTVSARRSLGSFSVHVFQVDEEDRRVTYEVNLYTGAGLGLGVGYVVRRDGIAVAHGP
ncbi:MAG TPA: hypothetical protein VGD56_07335 [Gemmatirosa sp.]